MHTPDAALPATRLRTPTLSVGQLGLRVLFFGAPFSVSAFVQYRIPGLPTSVLVVLVASGLLVLHLTWIRRVRVDGLTMLVGVCLLLPMFTAFAALPFSVLTTGIDYAAYVSEELWSRTINLLLYSLVFLAGYTTLVELHPEGRRRILGVYLAALGLFLFFGLWQWVSFYVGIPFPDLGGRTHLHSVSAEIRQLFPGRVTSLATEPSFLSPLMVDAAIIGLAVMGATRRYLLLVLLPATWILLFSFSGGGYFNVVVLAAFGLLLAALDLLRARVNVPVMAGGVVLAIVAVVLNQPLLRLFAPIVGRMGAFFDLQAHDRLYMVVMPFVWFMEDGPISAIFGHGPGSFALLGEMYRLPDGSRIHITSNNLFTDTLYEHGALGLLLLVVLFAVLLFIGIRGRHRSREYLLGAVLTMHLVTSSVYRADFMAPRFWVVLLSVCVLYRTAREATTRPTGATGRGNGVISGEEVPPAAVAARAV